MKRSIQVKPIHRHTYSERLLLSVLAFLLFQLTIPVVCNAQQPGKVKDSIYREKLGRERPVHSIIKTSIFSPFFWQIPLTGEYRLVGEVMIAPKQSLQFGASYLTRGIFFSIGQKIASAGNSGNVGIAMNGYRVQGAYRYYIFNHKYRPEGMYVSLHTSFASVKLNYKGYPNDYQMLEHFNINLLLGGQLLIASKVSIELFLGPGFKKNTYINRAPAHYLLDLDDLFPTLYKNVKFNLGMNMGFAL